MVDKPEMPPAVRAASAVLGVEALMTVLLGALVDQGILPRETLDKMRPAARRVLAHKLSMKASAPDLAVAIEEEAARSIERVFDHVAKLGFGGRRDN